MLCIYHVADHDGKGSAAIVKSAYPEVEFYGLNHGMDIPYEEINKHEQIVVCDISLPMDLMFELSQRKDFTWIDHHISVISKYDEYMATGKYKPIKGLRRVGTAAIQLTWEYFHPNQTTPEGVQLLGLNDLFDLRDPRVRPFEYAFQSCGVNRPGDPIWAELINNQVDIDCMVSKGEAILSWIRIRNYRLARSMAFESQFGGYKCICSNMAQGYSEFFDSLDNLSDYDILVNFYMSKQNTWNMTFYANKEGIDVSKIAASFGGGGHKGAAGASGLKQLPEFLQQGHSPNMLKK